MNIFVDLALPPGALEQLQAGTTGHQLLFSHTPATSVLSRPEPDPQLASAEIAFGQPDPLAIAGAKSLKWIHVSSSGITRYVGQRAAERQRQVSGLREHEAQDMHGAGFKVNAGAVGNGHVAFGHERAKLGIV